LLTEQVPARLRRLRTEERRLRELESQSDRFHVLESTGDPPERYVVRFDCTGIVGRSEFGPVLGEHHVVEIRLGANYPLAPPQLTWITPIFHPNISANGRTVCISTWYPTQFLDNLCHMLWRMIQFKNFDPGSALNNEAAAWAVANLALLPIDNRALMKSMPAGTREPTEPS
jgi:ubiquitin-protein ligase